jgi:hypothetical protein
MIAKLLHSKAFWLAAIDAAVKIVLIVLQSYWPDYLPLFNELWLAIQPVVLIVVAVFTVDDIEMKLEAYLAHFLAE